MDSCKTSQLTSTWPRNQCSRLHNNHHCTRSEYTWLNYEWNRINYNTLDAIAITITVHNLWCYWQPRSEWYFSTFASLHC